MGRLNHCLVNWQLIYKDPCVLQSIQGYQTDFINPPCQTRHLQAIIHTQEENSLIENETQELLTKGAIHSVLVHQRQEGFVSNLFLGRWSETSDKFKAIESFCEVRSRSFKKRRLSGQNRFEGRLLHSPYLGKPSNVSEVSLELESLRVCLPSIWANVHPTSFH